MFDLNHISVKEFFTLEEDQAKEYMKLQEIIKPSNEFGKYKAKKLGVLSFGQVASIKRNVLNPNYDSLIETFQLVYDVKVDQILNSDIVDFLQAFNYILESTKNLITKENKALSSDPDFDLEMAGINRLSVFGELSTLIAIAEKFGKTPQEVEEWQYNFVLSLMIHNKIYKEIEQKYNEIKQSNGRKRQA
ncbi:hypothetical protein [Aquimarina intermedia]|uniref:Uncharacterized protein n=1 Tax=Aquimarina intermedia TaxID=350814 RepID=A0A5S5BWE2_9FLAO|nr:hypothetical protein [Aquimarina intermedia]TYP71495.1 hypothetical protein BD809_10977 [Aquimarina intermedia]